MIQWIAIVLLGITAGVLSGLFGIGGGTVLVPLFIYLMKMDIHTATGTSLVVIIPTVAIGVIGHHFAGQIDWKAALIVAVLAAIGVYAGVKLNVMLPAHVLQRVFAVFLFFISIQLFFFHK